MVLMNEKLYKKYVYLTMKSLIWEAEGIIL